MPGGTELAIIAGVVVLLFGVNKLPRLGGAIGEGIRNFKKGVKDNTQALDDGNKEEASEKKKEVYFVSGTFLALVTLWV